MKKHWLYLRYLLRHKWFVFQAGLKTGAPLWRLVIHDWSKFTPAEWWPYAENFYGDGKILREKQKGPLGLLFSQRARLDWLQLQFDRAWLHHQHLNPHHWQHWVLREDSGDVKLLPIPKHFIREMVADWAGAGRAITGSWDLGVWYAKNKDRQLMEFFSRREVDILINTHWPVKDHSHTVTAIKIMRGEL
jgi:hypothetical protein